MSRPMYSPAVEGFEGLATYCDLFGQKRKDRVSQCEGKPSHQPSEVGLFLGCLYLRLLVEGLTNKMTIKLAVAHLLSNSLALRKYMMVGSKLPTWRASSPTWASAPKCMLMYLSSLIGCCELNNAALGKFSSVYCSLATCNQRMGASL